MQFIPVLLKAQLEELLLGIGSCDYGGWSKSDL